MKNETPNADRLIEKRLSEISAQFWVSYYERVGEHGSFRPTSNLKAAVREAEEFRDDPERNDDEVWYIGVEASGSDQFAIVKMTKDYLRKTDAGSFGDAESYKVWVTAAKKALSTGKTVVASF